MKNLLKAFLVGSSFPSFILFFLGFHRYVGTYHKKNCIAGVFKMEPYFFYTIIAPIYLGLMSVCAAMIDQHFKVSVRKAFFIISVISPVIVSTAITLCKVYTFSKDRLRQQYLRLFGYHMLLFNVVIANIYLMVEKC